MDANTADMITIGLGVAAFLEFGLLFLIYQYAGQTIKEILKAALWYKSYAIAGILQPDGRLSLKAADIGDELPDQWRIPRGKIWDDKRLEDGTQLAGPDRMDYAIFTAEGLSSIDMLEKAQSELFGTSSYITKIGDLKKAEGYIEGHEASKGAGFEHFFVQNWPIILGFIIILGIGLYVMWDKTITGPAGWSAANKCEQEKGQLASVCSRYVNIYNLNATTTASLPLSNTGGAVK